MEKTKAFAGALAAAVVVGSVGEFVSETVFHADKVGLLLGAVGAAIGWNFVGGTEIAEKEKPINGGYDARLVADRPQRLRTILDYNKKNSRVLVQQNDEIRSNVMEHVLNVHNAEYVESLKSKSASTDRPVRLNPLYARTLIDQHSYKAALMAASDWMDAVDRALEKEGPVRFCLTRPPSHHACRGKGKGGCLLNSVAIAATYARNHKNVNKVAILDIDAHHGNGIAHCVQDDPNIVFVSIHEDSPTFWSSSGKKEDDPRSPSSDDRGPLNNIRNYNLPPQSNWKDQYQPILSKALDNDLQDADLLLVAAGFDAMKVDWSSNLELNEEDYYELGCMIREKFGNRVAMGLEGGYAYQDQELPRALLQLVKPWHQQTKQQ